MRTRIAGLIGLGMMTQLGLLAVPLEPACADGEPPVGLVMAVSGSTTPALSEMAEIPANTPIQLGPSTQLTFLHYGPCKLVTISGGSLTLTRTERSADGKVVEEKDGPCPRMHPIRMAAGTVAGGMVMRSAPSLVRWPLNHELVVAGPFSDQIATAAIYEEERSDAPLVKLDVAGHHLRYPQQGDNPAPNGRYILRLGLKGRSEPLDLHFIGTAATGPDLLIVLREP